MPHRSGPLIVIVGLIVLAARAAHDVIADAVQPSGLGAWRLHGHYQYPAHRVTWWLAVIAIEVAIASWFVWRARRLSVTTGALAIVSALGWLVSAAICVDAPSYVIDHAWFVMLATAWLLIAATLAWTARVVGYLRRRRTADAAPPRGLLPPGARA